MTSAASSRAETEADGGRAERLGRALLDRFGLTDAVDARADHPALAWRRSGLLETTGRADGPGLMSPVAVTTVADGALLALKALAPGRVLPSCGALLLGERARLAGLSRQGERSANGSARLLKTLDGHVALNLARVEDWDALPALLGEPAGDWEAVAVQAARLRTDRLLEQGRLLGMAIGAEADAAAPEPFVIQSAGPARRPAASSPLVVDLSALWAGPLAGSLLAMAGARVVKVESRRRPDGARGGDKIFYDLLNGAKASVALDFADADDLRRLRALVEMADIVIESTRPRALAQLGVHADEAVARGATWLSITAYGRQGEASNWVGFGDDAAVAGGLSAAMRRAWGQSLFAGDAIADPLTGIMGGFAAWATWQTGGGLVSLALSDVVAYACALGETRGDELAGWRGLAARDTAPLYPLRAPDAPAPALGADTGSVFAGLS